MERGNRRLQYLIVSAVTSASVAVGVASSWAMPVLPKISANEVGFPINSAEVSWIAAIYSLGYLFGSLIARFTTDRCGRRISILGSSLPNTVGTMLVIFAWEPWMLCSGRFLSGCGTGMIIAVTGIYVAEIADKEIRGSLSIANRFMLSFGGLLVITVGTFVSYRTLNYILLALPVFYFAACWWIPESPYYLLKEGEVDAARKTLRMFTGIRDEDILEEKLSQIRSHVKTDMSKSATFKEFITGKRYRKAIIIVIGLRTAQIMTGLHAIQSYLGNILIESKSGINVSTALIIFGVFRFLLGIMSSALVDRVGRRPLLINSFLGTGVFLSIIAVYYGIHDPAQGHNYPYSLIPFICIIIALAISTLGFESVSYLIPAEVFPLNVKTIAMFLSQVSVGIMNFTAVKSYQQIKDTIGLNGLFILYASAAFSGAVFSHLFIPETKGKSLKEIQDELQEKNNYDEEENFNNVAVNLVKVEYKDTKS